MKMTNMKILAGDSENEFDADELEEMGDYSKNELAPTAAAKTPGKRGRLAKSMPARKTKKPKVSDDEDEEEILPKKKTGSKTKPPPPASIPTSVRGRGRANQILIAEPEDVEIKEEVDDNDDDDLEEEELNQGPNAKPVKNFTLGAFIVLKTDMIESANPPLWKIDDHSLLQKYISFEQDDKVLYKSTYVYSGWDFHVKEQYYLAPVSFIQQTRKEHIVEFYKDQIKIDPKVEEAAKRKLEEDEDESTDDNDELPDDDDESTDDNDELPDDDDESTDDGDESIDNDDDDDDEMEEQDDE